jgi:hypothetical protein
MEKPLEYFMQIIPHEIETKILSFLIPSCDSIVFRTDRKCGRVSKHEKAFIGCKVIENKTGLYLSRIPKKNGKHRYYITEEFVDVIHVEHNDREYPMYMYEYVSKYTGKDIEKALIKLILL